MIVQLDTHRLQTLGQVREFLDGSQEIDLRPQTRTEAYAFVAETVQRFDYAGRSKADKGLLRRFLAKATDLSRAQVTRLLRQYRTTGEVIDRRGAPRQPFPRRYTPADIGRLAELDALHGTLSGPTTRKLCARAFHRFGDPRFERLAAISNGHLYNLRHSITYQRRRGTVPAPTRSVQIAIGERRRPQPFGQPGHVRVDTVHQGDLDGVKGLYHLNLVDEVTQFQFIGSVEHIQAACLEAGSRSSAAGVPLHPPRIPRRQRLGVHQPRRGGAARSAAHRRVHQVPRPPLHRQRPGREQERLGHPQAPRLRPHPQPLRRASPCFQPAVPVALPQLPPALLLPQRRGGRQGPGAQAPPAVPPTS